MSEELELTDGPSGGLPDDSRRNLRADCGSCFGLCCVALPFTASADFAVDKAAGDPCVNLRPDSRCGIHAKLRGQGFRGCTVYDCFGAGQKVAQVTFGGHDWRENPDTAKQMFEVFSVMRPLHELLWYLTEALAFVPDDRWPDAPHNDDLAVDLLRGELGRALDDIERLTRADPGTLVDLDVPAHRAGVNTLLVRASELVRAGVASGADRPSRPRDGGRADLIGANLRGADLRGADLRGAYLIAADLSGADLRVADLIGVDLRDADLSGADLTGCLFLTQAQLDSAKGDAGTLVPRSLTRPAHW